MLTHLIKSVGAAAPLISALMYIIIKSDGSKLHIFTKM